MESEGSEDCLVTISATASFDLFEIAEYTQRAWSEDQSEIYLDFLLSSLKTRVLAGSTSRIELGSDVMHVVLARWPGAVYGHRLYFILEGRNNVRLLRVLHTAQSPPTRKLLTSLLDLE